MSAETIRRICLSYPMVTEHVQWEDHLVFKVAGKSFVITSFDPGGQFASIKCTPQSFAELVEKPGFIPAPYLARSHWVAIEHADVVSPSELAQLLRAAYDAVVEKLPKKVRLQVQSASAQ